MQTILGSGGAIGVELAKALKAYTNNLRLVSRYPVKVNPDDELVAADLLHAEQVMDAVKGSKVVYLTAGLEYDSTVWKRDWPRIVENVIEACTKEDCKLVFFDNVYMYDKNSMGNMTEDTKVIPPSKKGAVRAEISEKIMSAVWTGRLTALIARSADFYGPGNRGNSLLIETVFKPLSEGKKANWLGSANKKHSFTYTPDAAKATALLGNTEDAYEQVWHLPTAPYPFTGREWVTAVAAELGVEPKLRSVSKIMVKMMGLVMPIMKESAEMMYQYEQDYVFRSNKFRDRFDMEPTSYLQGIKEVVASDFRKDSREVTP